MGQEPPEALLSGQVRAEHYLAGVVQSWRSLDPVEFPFVHYIIDEIAGHNERNSSGPGSMYCRPACGSKRGVDP